MLLLLPNGSNEAVNCNKSLKALSFALLYLKLPFGVALVEVPLGDSTDYLLFSILLLFYDTIFMLDESDLRDLCEPILALF